MGGIVSSGKEKKKTRNEASEDAKTSPPIKGKKSLNEHKKIENIQRRRLASRMSLQKRGKGNRKMGKAEKTTNGEKQTKGGKKQK